MNARRANWYEHEANLVALDYLVDKGYLDNIAGLIGGHWVNSKMGVPSEFPHASFEEELDVMLHFLKQKKGLNVRVEVNQAERAIKVKIDEKDRFVVSIPSEDENNKKDN